MCECTLYNLTIVSAIVETVVNNDHLIVCYSKVLTPWSLGILDMAKTTLHALTKPMHVTEVPSKVLIPIGSQKDQGLRTSANSLLHVRGIICE